MSRFKKMGCARTEPSGFSSPSKDIHLGVISSSFGPRGAGGREILQGCEDQPRGNDKGYLIPFVREGLLAGSYNNSGFLSWDPEQKQSPVGISDVAADFWFQAQVDSVGEDGCGYEAPLEAAYRFLIDPDPYQTITRAVWQRRSTALRRTLGHRSGCSISALHSCVPTPSWSSCT